MKPLISFIKKLLTNGGLFFLVVFFTYKFVFSKVDILELKSTLYTIDPKFLLCAIFAVLFMLCAESFAMQCYLKMLGESKSIFKCGLFTLTGNFFSAITPAATGGQPMQLYFMHKNKIPASKGTLALLMDLGAYQFIIVSMALVGYVSYFHTINHYLGHFLPILWLGLAINSILLSITLTAIFSNKFIFNLALMVSKIIGFFKKDKQAIFLEKSQRSISRYKLSASILRKSKHLYFLTTIITFFRILAMHSVPFWIYRGFGFSESSFILIVALQSTLYISFAALPLPGGVGIGERGFLLYFSGVFGLTYLEPAMILSRGIGFYFIVALCGLTLAIITIVQSKNYKRVDTPDE